MKVAMMDPIDPTVPQAVINAVIVQAMLDEKYSERSAQRWAPYGDRNPYQYCDMTPVVRVAVHGPTDPEYCPDDLWYVEVQYSSKGGCAGYGVNRDHIPNCYMN